MASFTISAIVLFAAFTFQVVPLSSTHPIGCGCKKQFVQPQFQPPKGAYVKASKSSSSSASVEKSASADEQEVKANSLTGQYSKSGSSSASRSLAKNAEANEESFEAYAPGAVCGCGLLVRNSGESDYDYYVRVFQVDVANTESINAFYAKVFKQYKGESNADYINRITFIFTKVYPNLDCRFNQTYLKYLQKYYIICYAKLDGESDETWFTRVLTRTTENDAEYLVKTTILRKYITTVDWSRVDIDCSKYKTGFVLISSKDTSSSSARSLEEDSSSTKVVKKTLTVEEIKTTYARIESEDIATYYKRIVTKQSSTESTEEYIRTLTLVRQCYPTLSLWYDVTYYDMVKEYYTDLYAKMIDETDEDYFTRITTKEAFETDDQCAQRIQLVRSCYPNLVLWSDSKYFKITQKIYEVYYKKSTAEDESAYFKRIVARSAGETDSVYVSRLNLIKQTFPALDLWYSPEFVDISKQYYELLYIKKSEETNEIFYARIVKKQEFETDEQWVKRINVVRTLYPNLELWTDEKYFEQLTKTYYQTMYKKSTAEDDVTYFKRITTKLDGESDAVYVSRMDNVKRCYSSLDLWYSSEYSSYTREYYFAKYTKGSSETQELFYKRVMIKESGETDELWAQRVQLIHGFHPNWDLWYDSKFCDLTDQINLIYYKKSSSENELSYFKRLVERYDSETDEVYVKRITILKKTYSSLDLWYSTKYLDVVKSYYVARFTKISSETEEAHYQRVIAKEDGETDELWAQRIEIVHQFNPDWPLWCDAKYYELTKPVLLHLYKKSTSEDELTYFKRVILKTPSESEAVWVQRVTLIQQTYPELNLWYSSQYLELTKSFYSAKYTRTSTETEEIFYQRIITQESYETVEHYAERLEIIHGLYPNLCVWYDNKYFDQVKTAYITIFKKSTSEEEVAYYTRLTRKYELETDTVYLARMNALELTFSSLSLWYSTEYFDLVKPFYTLKYCKLPEESEEAYFSRLVARESCDVSDEVYAKRLYLVQLLTASNAFWYDAQYYEKYTKTFYMLYYSKQESESCDGWLTRAITLLPGEKNENAIKRVTLIKRALGNCGCWTVEALNKVEASNVFSKEYISVIRRSFFVSYSKTSSSSSSSTKSASSESNEDVVVIKRGEC